MRSLNWKSLITSVAMIVSGPGQAAEPTRAAAMAEPWFGDLPQMHERRVVRVLVAYDSTNYFIVDGEQHGMEYELMRRFEAHLNPDGIRADQRIHLLIRAVPFERLLPELEAGRGDIAAAGLTITEQRAAQVDFSDPYRKRVDEILVRGAQTVALRSVEDLAGLTVHVVNGSSYAEHLADLNQGFVTAGRAPIEIVPIDPVLNAEDLLQMIHAGVYDYTFVDNHKAELWAQVLDGVALQPEVAIRSGGQLGWAVRKGTPELLRTLNEFTAEHKQGSLLGNIFFKRYYGNIKWISNPLEPREQAKVRELAPLFQRYAEQYGFDWLALAAQGYQESGLDQSVRSGAGAVGVMQIKPSTAADRNVQISGVEDDAERNIHAATKYMAFLRDRYFSDPEIDPGSQVDFTLAAYNAGPGRIRQLRKKAAEAGLDPNRWFFHVEHIARQVVGREPVDYVANIHKYHDAYRTVLELRQERDAAAEAARSALE